MQEGTVKWFRGTYGFCWADGVPGDIFIHQTVIEAPPDAYRTLDDGQRVGVEWVTGPKGLIATRVVPR